jgi:ABC-type Fe3+ transport system permease subunit
VKLLLIGVVLAVVVYEGRIYARNKRFSALAVQIVTPPGPRWWEKALENIATVLLVVALLAAALRFMPRSDRTGPADDPSGTATPSPSAKSAAPTSTTSSTPGRGHTK